MACLALAFTACSGGEGGGGGDDFNGLSSNMDSVSYAIGMDIGKNFKTQGIEIEAAAMNKGLSDGMSGEATLLNDDQARAIMMAYQQVLNQKRQEKQAAAAGENKAKADKFLADNKSKPGIQTTATGLQYEVLKEGSGESPTVQDQVTTHYHGTLLDGTVFDSSVERGQPATFPLGGVIKAWQEILPMMKTGAKYRIYSPPELAYGEYGSPPKIGPNEALIFEIELISIGAAQQ